MSDSPVPLFDASAMLGPHPMMEVRTRTVSELTAVMDRFGIATSIVTSTVSSVHAPAVGNAEIVEQLAGNRRLLPSWTVLPDTCGEIYPAKEFVVRARESGVMATRAFPADHGYALDGPEMEDLHEALAAAKLPLVIGAAQTTWSALDAVACRHPLLTMIVTDVGYRSLRVLAGLLSRRENVHVDMAHLSSHVGIEWLVENFGVGRLVFGSGLPMRDPAEAVTRLMWSDLDDDDVTAIGHTTLHTLIGSAAAIA